MPNDDVVAGNRATAASTMDELMIAAPGDVTQRC